MSSDVKDISSDISGMVGKKDSLHAQILRIEQKVNDNAITARGYTKEKSCTEKKIERAKKVIKIDRRNKLSR